MPLHEISAWLGHTDIQTTSIYLRTTQASLMHAADRLERFREEQEQAGKKAKPPRRPPSTPRPHGGASVTVN